LRKKFNIVLFVIIGFLLSGCGSIEKSDSFTSEEESSCSSENDLLRADGSLSISGTITFDRISVGSSKIGLDHDNIIKSFAKQIVVKAIGPCEEIVATTTTNDKGEYLLSNLPKNSKIKIRVYAQMKKEGVNAWDIQVQDNTNQNKIYAMEGSLVSTGEKNSRRSLHAGLGWSSQLEHYTSPREAAPFAILDSIYSAMKRVIQSDSSVTFPKLLVNWSENNIASGDGSEAGLADGQIITSHFDGENNLYILGDADSDTDEFDDHIIIHEWGHYFEAKFSRADSIGGGHSEGEHLDIRVAFGEGWGNAFSAIATDDPIYYDTMGRSQRDGWSMNIESADKNEPGWFSEASIQRIIYDLYDAHDDGRDYLSLGFKPIYKVLTGAQKNTKAFTSLFPFITALKSENPQESAKIDAILADEDIGSINDIYGNDFHELYLDAYVGESKSVCTSTAYGYGNKLDTHKYIRFNVNSADRYNIRVIQRNGSSADPDFMLFRTSPFMQIGISDDTLSGKAEDSYSLDEGEYLLDISDYKGLPRPCFDVIISK
jgi:hypothetical protein